MNVSIRPLETGDKPEWARLWTDYLAFYETSREPKLYDIYFERRLGDDPRDFSGLVADAGDRLVGLTHYLLHRHGWSEADVCYLQDLYADPDTRGTGIGRKLIEGVYSAAENAGVSKVYWLTQDFNTVARRLYDRIGKKTPFIQYVKP